MRSRSTPSPLAPGLATGVLLAVVLGACGGSAKSTTVATTRAVTTISTTTVSSTESLPAPTRAGAGITAAQARSVPLGIAPSAVIARIGQPAVGLRPRGAERCMLYDIRGLAPRYRFQFCFQAARLVVIATYIR
jgi:hypothetical protein